MTIRTTIASAAVVTALFAVSPALAQEKTAEVDKIFSWVTPSTPGCAVAASHNGKVVVNRAYGLADLDRKVPITPETIFDAGSVVKQFVAASVLLLVEDGRVSLTDDIRKYIPELPETGHTITIDHLLTHTSGVRDWTGLFPFAADSPDALTLTVRQRGLNFAPGDEWAYSNSGYVLLKEMIARVSQLPFGEFARKRLFDPLEMKSTRYLLDMRDAGKDLAIAYEKRGDQWRQDMLLGNARGGGGGLFTTASDLLIWIDALAAGRLGEFVTRKIQEPAKLNDGTTVDYARGLMLETAQAPKIVWHGGSAAGFKTVVGHFPDHRFSVAIMCNAGESADRRTAFAGRIFDLFVPGARTAAGAPSRSTENRQPPAAGASGYAPAAAELEAFAGRYQSTEVGSIFRIAPAAGGLVLSLEHLPVRRVELTPLSPDVFKRGGMTVRFRRDAGGKVVALEFSTPVNRDIRFTRLAADGRSQ